MWYIFGFLALIFAISIVLLIMSADDFDRPIDFTKHILRNRPNQYLVCPQNYCPDTPNEISPQYPVSVKELETLLDEALKPEQRLIKIQTTGNEDLAVYQQSSAFFKFPDRITIKFIPIDETHSTLAVYSRAKYGRRDFDVNKLRVKRWFKRLDKQVFEYLAQKQNNDKK